MNEKKKVVGAGKVLVVEWFSACNISFQEMGKNSENKNNVRIYGP